MGAAHGGVVGDQDVGSRRHRITAVGSACRRGQRHTEPDRDAASHLNDLSPLVLMSQTTLEEAMTVFLPPHLSQQPLYQLTWRRARTMTLTA